MSGRDDPPMTVDRLVEVAYEYYTDFYEDPRRIHYMELSSQVGLRNVRALDYIAEALDLGCDDAEADREKRTRDEVTDYIGHPADDQWNLVAGDDNDTQHD